MYADGLQDRLVDLHGRLHRGYRVPPVRRVEIPSQTAENDHSDRYTRGQNCPKSGDGHVPIYESEFLGFSYGFRPGRGAHNALDALTVGIERKIDWILDADVCAFFDNVDRDWLIQFLEHRMR